MASGAAGAVLAGVGIVALGLNERVVDRPVIERVVLNPVAPAPGLTGNVIDGVRQRVAPSVVGILAAGAGRRGPATARWRARAWWCGTTASW